MQLQVKHIETATSLPLPSVRKLVRSFPLASLCFFTISLVLVVSIELQTPSPLMFPMLDPMEIYLSTNESMSLLQQRRHHQQIFAHTRP